MQAFGEGFVSYRPPVNTRTTEKLLNRKPNGNPEITLNWITPHQKWGIHSTYSDNLLMLTPSRGGPIIWLSEHDAAKAGIVDNDWVEVFNANGAATCRAVVSQRVKDGMVMMYHAQERIVNVPGSETTGTRGGHHNSVTRVVLKPTHMIGGYAQQAWGFNYYGTVGCNRDEFVVVRKMSKVDWLDEPRHGGLGGDALPQPLPPGHLRRDAMKIRSQVGMVLNLDKCIGCHTCSITCKNVWTSREGMEYAWFNNVETKPGIGYPKEWENQEKWKGGWVRAADGSIRPRIGGKFRVLANIFANPDLPEIDDYYEPFDFDYQHLHTAPKAEHQPVARPRSLVSGQRMEKIEWGPNWEEILGTEFAKRRKDKNFDQVQADIYGEYENTFMMYLPRLCEHCLNPACVASCPSGAIYKREEDGIVLIDQDKCRGWRMCISGCPYKKIYFNWKSGKSEKCIFCYPRIEAGQPTVCSETCVGRIRYLGVLLYDADRIHEVASCENERELYEKQLEIFLDPFDPAVIAQARKDGVADSVIEAAQKSPVYKLAMDWKLALPLHPEYRTLPMVWYVPPLSPIQNAAAEGHIGSDGVIPDVESLRIPVQYLANLLTAGDTAPVLLALKRLLAMRAYKRAEHVEGRQDLEVLAKVGLSVEQVEEMYRYLAIANYEDRFVIPSAHREEALSDAFAERSGCGFSFGNGCSGGSNPPSTCSAASRPTAAT